VLNKSKKHSNNDLEDHLGTFKPETSETEVGQSSYDASMMVTRNLIPAKQHQQTATKDIQRKMPRQQISETSLILQTSSLNTNGFPHSSYLKKTEPTSNNKTPVPRMTGRSTEQTPREKETGRPLFAKITPDFKKSQQEYRESALK